MRALASCAIALAVFTSTAVANTQAFRDQPARPVTAAAQSTIQKPAPSAESPEQRTAHALEAAKHNDGALYAFLRQMPKGGDLHNHDVGAVYAESLVRFAIANGLCVDPMTQQLTPSPCREGQVPAKQAETDMALYRELIDNWSMRGVKRSNRNGHDHFFDTFAKFGPATAGHMGEIFAEIANRAAAGNVQYLELMTTVDNAESLGFGAKIGWDSDLARLREKMLASGMKDIVARSRKNMDDWNAQKTSVLHCNDSNPAHRAPGCDVTIRHIYPGLRAFTPAQVFAQLLLAFELAQQDSRMVAVNLVQPEDWPVPMNDFQLHMKMVNFLKEQYPAVHISLHAGELAPGLVPPEGLRHHIRDSVEVGHAERIGHGVDVMHEDSPQQLLADLVHRNVLVEICLTSNNGILGVRGKDHPLRMYLNAGVPVALATDDEGVSRSEMTREYKRAVVDQGLDYPTLKKMARWSIEHAFLSGTSLWSDPHRFTPVHECSNDKPFANQVSGACQKFLNSSEKAREQWKLEHRFTDFEAKY